MNVVPMIGLDYKDKRPDALKFLAQGGDPYDVSVMDADGRVGINWGVYGVPETFIVDQKGIIRYKHIGPITTESLQKTILPIIERLRAQ
jgi:cytochrome c biogenesis protein CcmG/thiol:disulfide interchange protein DsbE